MRRKVPPVLILALPLAVMLMYMAAPSLAVAEEGPTNSELTNAEHFLEKLEAHVVRAGGKPFEMTYDDNEALRRVRELKEKYPDDPQVEEMFQRVRVAIMASKGDYIEITDEILAYRQMEAELVERVAAVADEQWQSILGDVAASGGEVMEAWPCPDPMETDPNATIGKYVLLDDFRYPDNEFTDMGGQFVHIGAGARGWYFVRLSTRAWLGAYEALKRYRRQVSQETPIPWTVLGRIDTVSLLIPQAGEERTMSPQFGWVVTPVAINVGGLVVSWADPEHELGGEYSAEAGLQELKWDMYTYTEVPDDVEPEQLVEIFATAIKEKNWDLYLECIDPARRATPTAIQRLQYFYDNNLERYRRWYVYVQVMEGYEIDVIKGTIIEEGSMEDFFLDEGQQETIAGRDQEIVEQALVEIRTYDENGQQSAFPKDVTLRRYNGGRWYIAAGYPL
ncbi:MAG: hypothetical protein D6E12_13935 [Desulfovibrio sp.]|nr:MAG: hypothetical protein D6E12_13935 [Desulfovibrio sp.]